MISFNTNDLLSDSYYQREYSTLYENDCEYFEFRYTEHQHFVLFSALKRKIEAVGQTKIDEELYDLETAYGYGGPLSNSDEPEFLKRAFSAYREYCVKHKIVCEFIRFHPFNPLSSQSTLFDMHFQERQVVIVDLEKTSDERRSEYSKTTRNIIKKAQSKLTSDFSNVDLASFIELYYETMQKNSASDFFYFPEEYFKKLMQMKNVHLIGIKSNDQYASIGFFMIGNKLAHYHLSANNQSLSKENGNYLLLDSAFEFAKEKGCRYMMLGGGRTASPDDSLFKFKQKFSPITLPFYIAGIDFLPEKRKWLNCLWRKQQENPQIPSLFQLYRASLK